MSIPKKPRIVNSIPTSSDGTSLTDCIEWMTSLGAEGIEENIEFRSSPGLCGNSLGLFAKKSFEVGDILFKIPQKSIINISNALSSPTSKEILAGFSALNDDSLNDIMTAELLFWVYMSEQFHMNGHYAPYLKTLNKEVPGPHAWCKDLLQCLRGTNLEILNGSQKILEDQSNLLISLIPTIISKPSSLLIMIFSFESLSWARGHYLSRGWDNIFELDFDGDDIVDVNDLSAMVPILDICNHKSGEDWVTLRAEDGMLLVVNHIAPLKVGDEIFSNYGDKSNEIFLYAYGFAEPANPFDSVSIKLGVGDEFPEQFYISRGEGIEGIPDDLWRTLVSISDMSKDDEDEGDDESSILRNGIGNIMGSDKDAARVDAFDEELSARIEMGVDECLLLLQFLQKKLEALHKSTPFVDTMRTQLAILGEDSGDYLRLRFISWYRAGQSEIMGATIEALENMIKTFDEEENQGESIAI